VHGHVDSLAPASGEEFALLPPDNATGNFTKIVQRIPVKIAIDTRRSVVRKAASGYVGRADDRYQAGFVRTAIRAGTMTGSATAAARRRSPSRRGLPLAER